MRRSSFSISISEAEELFQLKGEYSLHDVKSSFKRLAKTYHPDANKCYSPEDANAHMRRINEAFSLLKSLTYDNGKREAQPSHSARMKKKEYFKEKRDEDVEVKRRRQEEERLRREAVERQRQAEREKRRAEEAERERRKAEERKKQAAEERRRAAEQWRMYGEQRKKAEERIKREQEEALEEEYKSARSFFQRCLTSKDYEEASERFKKLGDYKDSQSLYSRCVKKMHRLKKLEHRGRTERDAIEHLPEFALAAVQIINSAIAFVACCNTDSPTAVALAFFMFGIPVVCGIFGFFEKPRRAFAIITLGITIPFALLFLPLYFINSYGAGTLESVPLFLIPQGLCAAGLLWSEEEEGRAITCLITSLVALVIALFVNFS